MASSISEQAAYFQLDVAKGFVDEGVMDKVFEVRESIASQYRQRKLQMPRDEHNYSEHEALRSVSSRFTEGFRVLKGQNHFESLFRDMNAIIDIAGFMLNTNAFLKTIEMLGDEQQVKHWRAQTLGGRAIGAYAQTQLGHGSNVQNLETEAHYDTATKTFRFISSKASSSKYWPGLLGIYCTHAVLQAQTFVGSKKIGVQTFVVPIRDHSLKTFDKVTSGDMGSKLGMAKVDHGYLMFDNYTLPRSAMLCRYIRIDDDGKVLGLENKQALKYGYGSMLNLRVYLASVFGFSIIKSSRKFVEAQRACGRFKGSSIGKSDEDVQSRAAADLCMGYGIVISNKQTYLLFREFSKHLAQKNFQQADSLMMDCHIISSTSKAVTSWLDNQIILGQMLFSRECALRSSQLPAWFTDMVPSVTYEGDNSLLLQLTGKYLLKTEPANRPKPETLNPRCLESMEAVAAYISERQIERLKQSIGKEMMAGNRDMQDIWNQSIQKEAIEVSKIWGNYILIRNYRASLAQVPSQYRLFYAKIGNVFANQLLHNIGRLPFYGIHLPTLDLTKDFTPQQKDDLFTAFELFEEETAYVLNSEYLDRKGKRLQTVVSEQMRAKL